MGEFLGAVVSFVVEAVVTLFFDAISTVGWNWRSRSKDDES